MTIDFRGFALAVALTLALTGALVFTARLGFDGAFLSLTFAVFFATFFATLRFATTFTRRAGFFATRFLAAVRSLAWLFLAFSAGRFFALLFFAMIRHLLVLNTCPTV